MKTKAPHGAFVYYREAINPTISPVRYSIPYARMIPPPENTIKLSQASNFVGADSALWIPMEYPPLKTFKGMSATPSNAAPPKRITKNAHPLLTPERRVCSKNQSPITAPAPYIKRTPATIYRAHFGIRIFAKFITL